MNQNDFDPFGDMLESLAELYGKTIKPTQTAMYFRVLSAYPLTAIQAAMDAHSKSSERGRFWPLPADLIAQLETMQTHDGRPTPEEAWSTAVQTHDEAISVAWTDETAQAWFQVGLALMDVGDRFNASRGFIDLYKRLVEASRKAGTPVCWSISPGEDKNLRRQVIEQAYRNRQITKDQAVALLPSLPADGDGAALEAIAGTVVKRIGGASSIRLERLDEIKTAGEAHQRGIAAMRTALESKPAELVKKFNPRHCLMIFERAESAGVFRGHDDRKHWLETAGAGGDMTELQTRILTQAGAA